MFRDDLLQALGGSTYDYNNRPAGLSEDKEEELSETYAALNILKSAIEHAQTYYLDVRQVNAFKRSAFGFDDFPNFVSSCTYIEFNGSITFDYVIAEDNVTTLSLDGRPVQISTQDSTRYRAVLIVFDKTTDRVMFNWYQDLSFVEREDGSTRAQMNSSSGYFSKQLWPNLDFEKMQRDNVSIELVKHMRRLFHMTVNLLYFISCENVTMVRIRPEHHQRHKLKGLPKSAVPYHVLPFQVPHYRYLNKEHEEGTKHGHRYDVRGHFRYLRDERYTRNEDGSVRRLWVDEHQRGLEHNIYVPALRRAPINSNVLDCDRFISELKKASVHAGNVSR